MKEDAGAALHVMVLYITKAEHNPAVYDVAGHDWMRRSGVRRDGPKMTS